MIFKCYYAELGGHVHMRLFSGKSEGALGKCGDLTMRIEEFAVFRLNSLFQFIDEGKKNADEVVQSDRAARDLSWDYNATGRP